MDSSSSNELLFDGQPLPEIALRYRDAIEAAGDCFFLLDAVRDGASRIVDFRYTDLNDRALGFLNQRRDFLIGRTLTESHPGNHLEYYVEHYAHVLETGIPFELETASRVIEGRYVNVRATRAGDGVAVSMRDVTVLNTHRQRIEHQNEQLHWLTAELRRANDLLEHAERLAKVGSWETELANGQNRWSAHMFRLFGYEPSGAPPTHDEWLLRLHPADVVSVEEAMHLSAATMKEVQFKHRIILPGGEVRVVETLCHPVPEENRLVGTTMDVTERDRWEQEVAATMLRTVEESVQIELHRQELTLQNERLIRLATTDGLTGIANHRTFQERLDDAMLASRRTHRPVSLVLLDVDRFKRFNDDFGHQAGDAVLRGVAAALTDACRNGDFVARYGGEEFAIILANADVRAARAAGERLRKAVEEYEWTYRPVTASVGVATLTGSILDRESLIRAADRSLYAAKAAGRNRVAHIDDLLEPTEAVIVGTCDPSSSPPPPSLRSA